MDTRVAKLIKLIAFLLLIATPVHAETKLIGFIGASASSGVGADDSCLNGGRYLSLPDALARSSGYWIISAAVAGCSSGDYVRQAGRIANMAQVNGELRLDILVIDVVAECVDNKCSLQQEQELFSRIGEITAVAEDVYGIHVLVIGYKTGTKSINPIWADRFKAKMEGMGIQYAEIYEGITTIDGVHPDTISMMKAATKLKTIIGELN